MIAVYHSGTRIYFLKIMFSIMLVVAVNFPKKKKKHIKDQQFSGRQINILKNNNISF